MEKGIDASFFPIIQPVNHPAGETIFIVKPGDYSRVISNYGCLGRVNNARIVVAFNVEGN